MVECPKCHKKIDWLAQLKEWDDEYGQDWESMAMISIMCYDCDTYVMVVDLAMAEDGEEIESPALGEKVKMPKLKN